MIHKNILVIMISNMKHKYLLFSFPFSSVAIVASIVSLFKVNSV